LLYLQRQDSDITEKKERRRKKKRLMLSTAGCAALSDRMMLSALDLTISNDVKTVIRAAIT